MSFDVLKVVHQITDAVFKVVFFCTLTRSSKRYKLLRRIMSFLFGSPFEISARVFLFVGTAEKHTTFVGAFLFHLTSHTRITMAAHREDWWLHVAPNPKGTRILLIRTHEIRPTITFFHHVFHYAHRRKLAMTVTYRMRLLRCSPSIDGFFEKIASVFRTKEIAARILTTKPKRTVFCRRTSCRFTV